MDAQQRFQQLQSQVEEARQASSEARGALSELMSQLRQKYGCKTLKEARVLLEKKQSEVAQLESRFNKQMDSYEEKWKRD